MVNQCRYGIAHGDYDQVALNGGLIALLVLPLGGIPASTGVKMRMTGTAKEVIGVSIGAMSVANQNNSTMGNNANLNTRLHTNQTNTETSRSQTSGISSCK